MATSAQMSKLTDRLKDIVRHTPLQKLDEYSRRFNAEIYVKREDLQVVRSYKIRGALNKMRKHESACRRIGVICASAGNHAQGVAYACATLQIKGVIFMPTPTPRQKVDRVLGFGAQWVDIKLVGDTFDDANEAAKKYSENNGGIIIPPFDDEDIIEGQSTVGVELLEDMRNNLPDYVFVPVGGGGLASGIGDVFHANELKTKLIGVEPAGAPSMTRSLELGQVVSLDHIDNFVDGAAVRKVGNLTFQRCRTYLDDMILVEEGKICTTLLSLYNEYGVVVEPAGALTLTALDQYADKLSGKRVVCIISGGNNDVMRMEEIKERSLLHEGLKHYFMVRFPQRVGALREFVNEVLGPDDDITHFEYTKKHNRSSGPAIVGIELKRKSDFQSLMLRMEKRGMLESYLNSDRHLMSILT